MFVVKQYTLFFFFQAEDGIRDLTVTGVQTCALPIWLGPGPTGHVPVRGDAARGPRAGRDRLRHCHRWRAGPHEGRQRGRRREIGRASCRGRVEISVVAVSLKKKKVDECIGKMSNEK